ncbi:hypothetical protein LTR70_004622 [Exophiala xenobiotica]|uniref:F-box domain-containing protein n=1 Tax=Lithohypha guttulata TaxID=1690604 RepID=A0ABR0KCQ7_9EURO|nr:hypothetical protein LTR24_004121 [Lithohypha guttulata]KAK5320395.1 hypothetical protein LTR70_004622 [Exophiala xenobiotica]
MAKKGRNQPTFKVRFQAPSQQAPSNQPHIEQHRELRAARTYQFVINQGNTAPFSPAPSSGPTSPGTPDITSRQFVFAANKSTVAFTERREEKSQSPAPKRRRTNKYPHDEKLAINARKPVKTYIPIDAWVLIFQRCHPKFLLDARLVCRDFRDVLNTQTIWRDARQHTFEALTKLGCPNGLTEMQYADLLVGRGCQIKPCIRQETRKIYWPFMLRMCENCLEQQVQGPRRHSPEATAYSEHRWNLEPEVRYTIPEHLMSLLPAGVMVCGKWVEARRLRADKQMWEKEGGNYYVIAQEYERLRSEFEREVMREPLKFLSWVRTKWNATRDRMDLAKTLSRLDWNSILKRGSNRDEKAQFFEEKAQELNPSMGPAVLNKMAAYHSIVDNSSAPSLRSWDLLAQKIDKAELRAQAEQLLEWEQLSDKTHTTIANMVDEGSGFLHDKLFEHRNTVQATGPPKLRRKQRVAEQEVVIEIAQHELDDILDDVHDEDVLLLLLDNVRKSYEALDSKPIGLNGDGSRGEYRLLLDDARMVVNDVLAPRIGNKGSTRFQKIMASLRCVGCTRQDARRLDTFEQLVYHIRSTHAKYVGPDMHFWKWAVPVQTRLRSSKDPVAWYHIPWPRSMPALPAHRKATRDMIWDPDEEQEYVDRPIEEKLDLFSGLEANSNANIAADDFTGNFCKAVRLLAETRLDSQCKMRLALEYATKRQFQNGPRRSTAKMLCPAMLQNLAMATLGMSSDLKFKFECGLCLKDKCEDNVRELHFARDLDNLCSHWRYLHQLEEEDQMEDLISLPSDFEVHRTMTGLDARLQAQKSRAESKEKKFASGDDSEILGKRDPRSAALLDIPSIRSRFDALFVKRQIESELPTILPDEETGTPEENLAREQQA